MQVGAVFSFYFERARSGFVVSPLGDSCSPQPSRAELGQVLIRLFQAATSATTHVFTSHCSIQQAQHEASLLRL
jgi:hypothetical protein